MAVKFRQYGLQRGGVPSATENAPTPEAGERAEASTQGRPQLDERFPPAQESPLGRDSGTGEDRHPA